MQVQSEAAGVVPLVDPILTQAVHARVRFRSARYNAMLGVSGRRLKFTRHHNIFEICPAMPGAVRIVCPHEPHTGWRVSDAHGTISIGRTDDANSLFVIERGEHHHVYSIRSVATGKVCVALCSGLLANRDHKQLWEHFSIEFA